MSSVFSVYLAYSAYSYSRHSESLGVTGQSTEIVKIIIKQSMHFVNLTCIILTSTLLKFVTDFSKLSAG